MNATELTAKLRATTEEQNTLIAMFVASGDNHWMAAIRILGADIAEYTAKLRRINRHPE